MSKITLVKIDVRLALFCASDMKTALNSLKNTACGCLASQVKRPVSSMQHLSAQVMTSETFCGPSYGYCWLKPNLRRTEPIAKRGLLPPP